jgi:hypothetical protein
VCLRAVLGHGCVLRTIDVSLSGEGEAVLVVSVEELRWKVLDALRSKMSKGGDKGLALRRLGVDCDKECG